MALPPNTTHLTQPLDKGTYGPLKIEWRKVCHEYVVQNPGKVITQNNFFTLFSKTWMKSMTITNIMAGFSTAGIYPLDRNKVGRSNVHSTKTTQQALIFTIADTSTFTIHEPKQ